LEPSVRILVVDDEVLIGHSVEDALQESGYSVCLAHSGADAISVLDGAKGSIVGLVTDIRMGNGPDGWDVGRRARELNALMPVVYMSGDSASDHSSRGVPDSVMVQKPFVGAQIVTAISQLLNAIPQHSADRSS
jgi:DNA-binding response OmpR family regulator